MLKPLRIAFVANSKNPTRFMADPAFIYRCENLALALKTLGHHIELIHVSQLSSRQYYDIVVLHRPRQHWLLSWRTARLKRRGCRIIADFDDLVFLPEWASVSPGVINGLVSLKQTQENFSSHQAALNYCDAYTVSVLPLQQKMERTNNKPVLYLPNTVHKNWYALNEASDKHIAPKLTYFSGTRSHDKDFALIQPVLEQLLHENPYLELHITGVLSTNIQCRNKQVVLHPKKPFLDYALHVAQSWVNLAPLENTEFNMHKSALKAIEAAWFNTPTLATPIPDMQRLQHAGALLMHDSDSWYHTIKALMNKEKYAATCCNLRQRIMQCGSIEQNAETFLAFYKTL